MVLTAQQILQVFQLTVVKTIKITLQKAFEDEVELKKSPTTLPTQSPPVDVHTARLTIMSLILPIARVGLRLFGQTSTQFMML
jgi:hypothetical protein